MRTPAKTLRVAAPLILILLAPSGASAPAADPANPPSATACLHMETRYAAGATFGCVKFAVLRNSCDANVVAEVRRTQRLFSGTLRDAFAVVVPAGGEQALDCSWWSGAMTPTEQELIGAQFLPDPPRRGGGDDHNDSCQR